MVRPVDKLGRVVIPREIRRQFDITNDEDSFEIFIEDDMIILKKYQPSCIFCGRADHTIQHKGHIICKDCIQTLNQVLKEENE